jgi:hypothetical protein
MEGPNLWLLNEYRKTRCCHLCVLPFLTRVE